MAHEPWHVDVGALSGSGLGNSPTLANTASGFVQTGAGLDPNSPLSGNVGSSPMANTGNFFSNLLGNIGNIGLGDLAGAGLSYANLQNYYDQYGDIAREAATGAREIGQEAAAASQFRPFTVSTGFGGVTTTPEGGFGTTLSPQQQARQEALSGITGGLLGSYTGAGVPDVSGIQQQALGGVTGALTGFMTPMAAREADVFERIRAVQRPEEERQRIALQEQLQAQGRTGLRTAQFGGSPEQFALAQAQEEAKNRAALAALGQAGTERQQDLASAQGLFGLGQQAAGLPAVLQAAQLQNIGAGLGLEATPEQQLLSTLSPAINIASLADVGRRGGAGLAAEAGISGLEALAQTELGRASALRDLYTSVLGAGGAAAGDNTSLFQKIIDAL
jgi:hypothetical protein